MAVVESKHVAMPEVVDEQGRHIIPFK